jgi:hypothetical protein
MNPLAVMDCIIVGCSALFGWHAFDKTRVFAQWAKTVFIIFAIIGVTTGLCGMARDIGWFALSEECNRVLGNSLALGRGSLLGLLVALILSRQLIGTKRVN